MAEHEEGLGRFTCIWCKRSYPLYEKAVHAMEEHGYQEIPKAPRLKMKQMALPGVMPEKRRITD